MQHLTEPDPARPTTDAAYLAAEGFEPQLAAELGRCGATISAWRGRLAPSPDPPVRAAWALDTWRQPQEFAAPSVKAAADIRWSCLVSCSDGRPLSAIVPSEDQRAGADAAIC